MIQHHEQRIEYAVARGDMTVGYEVVYHFIDIVECGVIMERELQKVTVEGDLPLGLKKCIALRLRQQQYDAAGQAVDDYMSVALATQEMAL